MTKHVSITLFIMTSIIFSFYPSMAQQKEVSSKDKQAVELSDSELKSFVNVLKEVNKVQKSYQDEMVNLVNESGLEIERFNQIANAQQSTSLEFSKEEMASFKSAVEQLKTTQQEMQEKLHEVVENSGMQPMRYQEIMNQLNQDEKLQQKIKSMMQ